MKHIKKGNNDVAVIDKRDVWVTCSLFINWNSWNVFAK